MKTEAEARKCWCPFVRLLIVDDNRNVVQMPPANACSQNGERLGMPAAHCIASECAAWRWYDKLSEDGSIALRLNWVSADGESWQGTEMPLKDRRGYCGLAGKP